VAQALLLSASLADY